MEATGIHFLFDRWKAGIKSMLSQNLASNIDKNFDALEPHVQKQLSRYGINADQWALIQKTSDTLRGFNGNKYLTPTSIKEGLGDKDIQQVLKNRGTVSDALRDDVAAKQAHYDATKQKLDEARSKSASLTQIGTKEEIAARSFVTRYANELKQAESSLNAHQQILDARLGKIKATPDIQQALDRYSEYDQGIDSKSADALRNSISDKILSMYSDAAREGVVSPGIKEQALMYGNLKKGTATSEGIKFLLQFNAWPLAAYNQILERNIYQSLSKKDVVYNMGMLVALGVPAGYARMCLNAKISGQPIPNPLSIKTILSATAQSGALGIMGDELFGQIQRMGTAGIVALAGPAVGDINDIASLYGKAMGNAEGENHKLWPDLARLAVNHVPFANLFYIKGAYDYLLAYHLLEAASPGWWERQNQRMRKETGNTMIGYTPGAGVPWGVPGVYLSKGNASSGVLGNGKLGGIH